MAASLAPHVFSVMPAVSETDLRPPFKVDKATNPKVLPHPRRESKMGMHDHTCMLKLWKEGCTKLLMLSCVHSQHNFTIHFYVLFPLKSW